MLNDEASGGYFSVKIQSFKCVFIISSRNFENDTIR
jgi:hypothetical protein